MNLKRQKIDLLLGARWLIASGEKLYICDALCKADGNDDGQRYVMSDACRELRNWINEMLGNRFCLHQWIEDEGYALPKPAPGVVGFNTVDNWRAKLPKMRQTRLNWIDWMIEEVRRCG